MIFFPLSPWSGTGGERAIERGEDPPGQLCSNEKRLGNTTWPRTPTLGERGALPFLSACFLKNLALGLHSVLDLTPPPSPLHPRMSPFSLRSSIRPPLKRTRGGPPRRAVNWPVFLARSIGSSIAGSSTNEEFAFPPPLTRVRGLENDEGFVGFYVEHRVLSAILHLSGMGNDFFSTSLTMFPIGGTVSFSAVSPPTDHSPGQARLRNLH